MKRMILAIPLLLASLAFISAPAANRMTGNTQREEAVVEFTELVTLPGGSRGGPYLTYNDAEMREAGRPCPYIYTMKAGNRAQLVIAVNCEPVERKPVKEFTVLLTPRNSAYTVREVREIQFAGVA